MILLNHQHLYYFWTVAKEGSVARACKRLHLAQSTVSGQVIQLEKHLGQSLFERQGKQLILTTKGRLVLDYAEKIFSHTQEMLDVLDHGKAGTTRLNLGVDDDVSKQIVVKVLTALYQRYDHLHVKVYDGRLPELMERAQKHTLDLILCGQGGTSGQNADFMRSEIGRFEIVFAAAPSIARKIKKFPKDLSGVPLIVPGQDSPLWTHLQHYLVRHKIESPTLMEIQDAELMRIAALEGLGVAPLNEISIEKDVAQRALVRLGRSSTGLTKTLWFVALKSHASHPLVKGLMDRFKSPGFQA